MAASEAGFDASQGKEVLSNIQKNLGEGVECSIRNKQIEMLRGREYSNKLVGNLYSEDIVVVDMSLKILAHCAMDEIYARNASNMAASEADFHGFPGREVLSYIQKNLGEGVEWSIRSTQIEMLRGREYSEKLVGNLYYRDLVVIDMSLNILAHCAMDEICARNAVRYNILASLNQLFNRYTRENTINERIFRVLRNLCIHEKDWAAKIITDTPDLVSHIVEQLIWENNLSEATLLMMLRLLRLLVNDDTSEGLLEFHVLEALYVLLIKLIREYECNGAYKEVIIIGIEIVHQFSMFATGNTSNQMSQTAAENAHLFMGKFMGKLVVLSPLKVVQIVLAYNHDQRRETLEEMFQKLAEALSGLKYSDINKNNLELIEDACLLVKRVIPFYLVPQLFIETLIKVFDLFEEPTNTEWKYCLLILHTVSQCRGGVSRFPQIGQVIVNKLKWALSDKKDILTLNVRNMWEEMGSTQQPRSVDEKECSLWSKDPAAKRSFENCHTSNLRRECSPSLSKIDYVQLWGNNYASFSRTFSSYIQLADSFSKTLASSWNNQREKCKPVDTLKVKLIDDIETFIERHIESPYLNFHAENIIALLLNCVYHYNRDIESLVNIIQCSFVFETAVKSPLMEKVFALMQFQYKKTCEKCRKAGRLGQFIHSLFTTMAATESGKMYMRETMLGGSKAEKQQLAMSLPYLSINYLQEVMVELGGIYSLMDALKNVPEYRQRAISTANAMTFFWTNELIPTVMVPQEYPSSSTTPITTGRQVTVKLDDGSAVRVYRDFLTERSDFFAALLKGNFREGAEDEVLLREVKRMPLLLVLAMMCPAVYFLLGEKGVPVSVVLEAVVLCDKFLLKNDLLPLPSLPRTASVISMQLLSQEFSGQERVVPFINLYEFRITALNILFEFGFGGEVVEDLRFLLEKFFKLRTCNTRSLSLTP